MAKRLAASMLFCLALGCGRGEAPGPEKVPPANVKWQGPSSIALEEWTELVGTTVPLPNRVAYVSAAVQGQVVEVFGDPTAKNPVAEGQQIKEGTVLVRLDTSVIAANVARATASLKGINEEITQAQYAVELAEADVDRLKKLAAEENTRPNGNRDRLVSPVERLKADYALKDAKSKLEGARNRLEAATKDRDALQKQMDLYTLKAPIAGRVGRIEVAPGQTISAGSPVADILDIEEKIDVLCFVPPALVRRLKVGQEAWSSAIDKDPASSEPDVQGHIEYIAEVAEPETGNFAVKVRFDDNKDAKLRANRVLRIRVQTEETKECLAVPESAVNESEETPTVVIAESRVEKNEKGQEETVYYARRLQAELGIHDRVKHQIEIVNLIDPEKDPKKRWQGTVKDAQFIVKGGQGLETGDKVKLEAEED